MKERNQSHLDVHHELLSEFVKYGETLESDEESESDDDVTTLEVLDQKSIGSEDTIVEDFDDAMEADYASNEVGEQNNEIN